MTKYLKLFALICLTAGMLSACAPCKTKHCPKKHKTETVQMSCSCTEDGKTCTCTK
ncbi:MAG: hypothetical protein IJC30_03620 [Alphaproteobacteria bacterium]|nr:hypothetical protein [Alphaproteobacteria bacterium]